MQHARYASRAAALATVLILAGAAVADEIQIVACPSASTEGIGRFIGTINYASAGGNAGTLTVSLKNTTAPADGGFLTGFLFNIHSADPAAAAALLAGATHPFTFASGSGSPFGAGFDAGAALGGSFLGGGSPVNGIAIGATGTFTFHVTASDAASLHATDFIMGPYQHNFVVRFKGLTGGGSDKVPAIRTCPTDFDADGLVGPIDLAYLLGQWGPNPASRADFNGDGVVDGHDLVQILAGWGPCGSD